MESESYYASEGDIAYIRVRSPQGRVTSEEEEWGLRDFDESGARASERWIELDRHDPLARRERT